MWDHEIDPENIPDTPWRNYRLYSKDGAALVDYYSLRNGEFQHGETGSHGEIFPANVIREEIASFNATGFGPVTLRALSAPEKQEAA